MNQDLLKQYINLLKPEKPNLAALAVPGDELGELGERGQIKLSIPDKPKSSKQLYYSE